ncbi:hypothetical protein WICPIJ_000712 [Wickerhamomyces pijperi]|uniref:Uncharacterized protein n=1 Tax=Wickerhamomyces pijperi TaxID=599730 RepID=A0A9P8QFU0_WICPI|nr:hypothetical protein WICPIJ_000712 [Wickerhamomyces pijperi]
MITVLPASADLTAAANKFLVPLAKLSNSKTPGGPFQTMVLALATAAAYKAEDFSPASKPSVTKSTGKTISTLFFLAFSIKAGTNLAPSASKIDSPISVLSKTFLKVKAIPPPTIKISTLSNKLSINWILSETLAPPKIAKNGLTGFSKALAK